MATVLFVCLHNAGRSQMSQALFERAGPALSLTSSRRAERIEHIRSRDAPHPTQDEPRCNSRPNLHALVICEDVLTGSSAGL